MLSALEYNLKHESNFYITFHENDQECVPSFLFQKETRPFENWFFIKLKYRQVVKEISRKILMQKFSQRIDTTAPSALTNAAIV